MIVQIDDFYSINSNALRTGHSITVDDYYRTGNSLNIDQQTQYDISTYKYVAVKQYYIDIIRFRGSNSGEDWDAAANAHSLTQVCFYTSDTTFSISDWASGLKQCFYFEMDGLVSTFKGVKLKDFTLNGYNTGIYGWIDGPYVNANLYFYHNVPLFSYTEEPALAIELGTTSNSRGQDFNVYSPIDSETGDYFGTEITSMAKDNTETGGFENGGLSVASWNANPAYVTAGYGFTTVRTSFSRDINTYDGFDRPLLSTMIFCLYLFAEGTLNSELTAKQCEIVELSPFYPMM